MKLVYIQSCVHARVKLATPLAPSDTWAILICAKNKPQTQINSVFISFPLFLSSSFLVFLPVSFLFLSSFPFYVVLLLSLHKYKKMGSDRAHPKAIPFLTTNHIDNSIYICHHLPNFHALWISSMKWGSIAGMCHQFHHLGSIVAV